MRIEQNLVLNCTCPIADCPAQPTGAFIRAIVSSPEVISKVSPPLREAQCTARWAGPREWAGMRGAGGPEDVASWQARPSLGGTCVPQYEKALLRGYVESCSNLTWCTNPQGCDRILCRQSLGCGTTCSKCGWASCFTCSFPEVGPHPGPDAEPGSTPLPAAPTQILPCSHPRPPSGALFLPTHTSGAALSKGSAMSSLPPPALGTLPCQLWPHVSVGR